MHAQTTHLIGEVMGLAERRATKEFQDKQLPALQAAIDAAAGFPVSLNIQWEQLAKEDVSHGYAEGWPKVYFEPVINAFKSIARDAMGKEALKAGLREVCFKNTQNYASSTSGISFSAGVLVIDHDPWCNVDYVDERAEYCVKLLEKNL
jgi:hypothetical protein